MVAKDLRFLIDAVREGRLSYRVRPDRHEEGERLTLHLLGVSVPVRARAIFEMDRFMGGGFAGQVYRVRLVECRGTVPEGLRIGGLCALKIYRPPSRSARRFRDGIYRLAFQGPFAAQVHQAAARAGLLWQKCIRAAAGEAFGSADCVKDVWASFYDPVLASYGEVTEWVEGRTWRLEADPDIGRRIRRRELRPDETASVEYVAKKRFMAALVRLLHALGAPELARQYEWSTLKSQPNVLLRTDRDGRAPGTDLCAIDFRAGLALLPFLPMSPGDVKLILRGLRRGAWVQYDRGEVSRLEEYVARRPAVFRGMEGMLDELRRQERLYRRSQPDVTRQALRLVTDSGLRRSVRAGLVRGYAQAGLVDGAHAVRLRRGGGCFAAFYLAGALPWLGRFLRRCWGRKAYREHLRRLFSEPGYWTRAVRQAAAVDLLAWRRAHRVSDRRARFLLRHSACFFVERWTLGWLPFPRLHRAITDPAGLLRHLGGLLAFLWHFATRPAVREQWFLRQLEEGERDGMLTATEREDIATHVKEPYIAKYLRCMAVHFATIPVTQLVGLAIGGFAAVWMLGRGYSGAQAAMTFAGVLVAFQVFPVSPGSVCRGGYVVYLMIRERNLRDYRIAAPLSFLKYIGYLAFPLQMTARYPHLARFLAGRWATSAARRIPIFGERGALLEHWMFDLFFNIPQAAARWAAPRRRFLLGWWMLFGLAAVGAGFLAARWEPWSRQGVNALLVALVVFVLPFLTWGLRGKRCVRFEGKREEGGGEG